MKNNSTSNELMILSHKFGTIDPIIGCQLPRIIVCLNADELKKTNYNIDQLIRHCEDHLKERYSGSLITILQTSINDITLDNQNIKKDSFVIKVELFNIFNVTQAHYYNEKQVSIEVQAAIKKFIPKANLPISASDPINNKLSKMLVISSVFNEFCQTGLFNDGEYFNCLDLKGNPLLINKSIQTNNGIDLGYALFDAKGNVLCVIHESISLKNIYHFFVLFSEMQTTIENHYSKFMSSKILSIMKGSGNFLDCKDPEFAKAVCAELLNSYKKSLVELISEEKFCSNNNLQMLIDKQFQKSIDYAVLNFTSEIQDFCRLRD